MKHLFIINPAAQYVVGRVAEIRAEIETCFSPYPQLAYDIHVTRWQRDAVGFIKRYCQAASDLVRIYAVGGVGTLFEVINGAMEMPNVQVACCLGDGDDAFICSPGGRRPRLFDAIGDLVFARVMPVDVIRCGNNGYALAFSLFGAEATISHLGSELARRYRAAAGICHLYAGLSSLLWRGAEQRYSILLDGDIRLDGEYLGALIANYSCHGRSLNSSADASPSDGALDLYLWKQVPRIGGVKIAVDYARGHCRAWPEYIQHYRFRRMTLQSGDLIATSLDGEFSYQTEMEYEVLPCALDFVCPENVDLETHFSPLAGQGEE
ncbi:MAG: hypothetical protein LBB55_03610 [Zoogloeaceae bacterium]|jgi:diacylglycerol kinase family enzyme|nr:hypothetical protein [Zoogloeaceae bacterium]